MFKRSEKKIKAVFKMQFEATQVPQLKAKRVMISLVPVDVGKPTVRLAKVPILEGTCTWESPVYETVKLVQEIKTGRIREKFYYVVVSTGSSKSGFLGEVSIDFADLAEATKPLNLNLPLQTSKSGAVLHVTVQRMQGGPDSRHDDNSEAPPEDDENMDTEGRDSYSFRKSNTKSTESDDLSGVSTPHEEQNVSIEDVVSDYNHTVSNDRGVAETSNELTNQMKMFERKAELSELEVQTLRKQITKETRRGQQLLDQILCLKEEKDALRAECERLKSESVSAHTQKGTEDVGSSIENIKQEVQHQKDLNKKLKSQLQKAEDSNSEFVLTMRDLTKKMDQKNTEISQLSSKIKSLHVDESETLQQKIDELYFEIEVHKKEKAGLRTDVERLILDYKRLETENKDICLELEQNEKEKMEIQQDYTESLATERNLKIQVASLEAENKTQALQYSESLNMIDELGFQVESLQNELDKQAHIFAENLEAVTEAKVENEERALQAEEVLRKTKLKSENASERLQEEFTQISAEMALKIEENAILAQEAVTEANDLRQENEVLEELLEKTKEQLRIITDQCETISRERLDQSDVIAEMSKQKTISREESKTLNRWKSEKEDLERQLASVRKEAETTMHENVSMKSQIDLKKIKEENLLLEVKKLRLKNDEVKNLMLELQLQKEGLKKEMSILQESLHKKEQERERAALQSSVTSLVKEKNNRHNTKKVGISVEQLEQESMQAEHINSTVLEGRKNKGEHIKGVEIRALGDFPVQNSRQPDDYCDVSGLFSEVASLKERNKSMDDELKEMHERYSEISLRFAEVEGERQQLVMTLRNLKGGKKN